MIDDDLLFAGVTGQAERVRSGDLSAAALLEAVLARIEQVDPHLNAVTVVLADAARAEAARRDAALAAGERPGPLHGVPVAIKEENHVAGAVTTFGGPANHRPARDDGAVTRRLRAAGAVVVAKTAMPEFGLWPFTESDRHGVTRNPWDTGRTPGGSSGGSAVAVATGMVPVAIGGDGGGSIRIPAACCGLFGLKPTRGRVSAAPASALWGALGTIGPLTRSVLDSAVVYDVLRGEEPGDRYRQPEPEAPFAEAARLTTAASQRRLRVGWSTRPVTRGMRLAAEHVTAVEETAAALEALGHDVREIDPRYPDPTAAFVPQYLEGLRSELPLLEDPRRVERRTGQLLALGRPLGARAVAWAEWRGERLARRVDGFVFGAVDALLTPTITHRPRPVGVLENRSAVGATAAAMPMVAYTALWNVTGHPAASVPAGIADDGLPTAVQLVARRGDEATLLALSAQLESVRPWADRRPVVEPPSSEAEQLGGLLGARRRLLGR